MPGGPWRSSNRGCITASSPHFRPVHGIFHWAFGALRSRPVAVAQFKHAGIHRSDQLDLVPVHMSLHRESRLAWLLLLDFTQERLCKTWVTKALCYYLANLCSKLLTTVGKRQWFKPDSRAMLGLECHSIDVNSIDVVTKSLARSCEKVMYSMWYLYMETFCRAKLDIRLGINALPLLV